jgi:hypothetical protein
MERPPPTRENDILLTPCEIHENRVQPMRGIRHENDFFGPSADELGYAMSGRCEVLGNMQFDESVDIPFYGPGCGLDGSRNWDWYGTVGAYKRHQVSRRLCGKWPDRCSDLHNLAQSQSTCVADGQMAEGAQPQQAWSLARVRIRIRSACGR